VCVRKKHVKTSNIPNHTYRRGDPSCFNYLLNISMTPYKSDQYMSSFTTKCIR